MQPWSATGNYQVATINAFFTAPYIVEHDSYWVEKIELVNSDHRLHKHCVDPLLPKDEHLKRLCARSELSLQAEITFSDAWQSHPSSYSQEATASSSVAFEPPLCAPQTQLAGG